MAQEGRAAPCRTHEIALAPLPGAGPRPRLHAVSDRTHEHLAGRYGPAAGEVLAIAAAEPGAGSPIVEGHPDLLAEAVYAARHEQARSVGDVLLRRTRLGLLAAREVCDPAGAVARRVANAMAPELGWGDRRAAHEAAAWAREARAEGLVVDQLRPGARRTPTPTRGTRTP